MQASSIAVARPDAAAETVIIGRVVAIADGDTLTVLTDARQQVRVIGVSAKPKAPELAAIDAPERAQPYGSRPRQALSELAFGKDVLVAVHGRNGVSPGDTDRYGRTVGQVRADDRDVNAELVRRGAAWVYRRYSQDPVLLALEAEARQARRGLWALPEAEQVPPLETPFSGIARAMPYVSPFGTDRFAMEWRAAGREERQQRRAEAVR